MFLPGTKFDKYEIENELGEGGVGIVYKACDTEGDVLVALKILNKETAKSATSRDQLIAEAKLSSAVDSPYVVKIRDYGITDETPFIAMELVNGSELRDRLGDFSFEEKAEIAIRLGLGIQAAHDTGLVHRDLKPENVLIDEDGSPKILDFGLAREVETDSVDEFGDVAGTLYYLSPEQLAGETITAGSDIFSYGTILYELFAGRRPFEGEHSSSIIYSILHEDPPLPSDVADNIPRWLDELIMKLLAKRVEERYNPILDAIRFIEAHKDQTDATGEKFVKARQTVTVIDLRNMSGDESWQYFCEGFTDDVIRELNRRTDLIVSAEPSSSFGRDIKEVFKQCRSDYVITGTLLKWHEKIKLSLKVIGSGGDEVVWDSSYTESAENLFELLSRAATEATARLSTATNSPLVGVEEERPHDVTAYDDYLKGKNYYQTNKPEDLEFATKMYKKALKIEPDFALALAGLSDVYSFQYMAYYDRTTECIENARKYATASLESDALLPEGHRSMGRYHMFTGDQEKAKGCFLKAIEYNPKYAVAYRTLGWLMMQEGDYAQAIDWARRSLEYAPTDLETLLLISLLHMGEGKYTLAMSTLQRAIELGPDYGRAYYLLGQVYLKLGVAKLALENFELSCKYKGDLNCFTDADFVHFILGDNEKAQTFLQQAISENALPFVAHYYLGMIEEAVSYRGAAQVHYLQSLMALKDYDFTNSENIPMQVFLALSQAGLDLTDEARATLEDIESHGPHNGEILFNMARCYMLIDDPAEAERVLSLAVETKGGPTDKEIALDPHFAALERNVV